MTSQTASVRLFAAFLGLAPALGVAIAVPVASASPSDRNGPEARLAAFRRAPAGAHPPGAEESAAELAEIGREFLDRGDLGQAIELLRESAASGRTDAATLAWLVLANARRGDLEFGRPYLEMAAASDPSPAVPASIYREIGERYSDENRLEAAALAWDLALRRDGSDRELSRRLDRARREISVTAGQHSLAGDGFTLFADDAIPAEALQRIEHTLAGEYASQAARFGSALAVPQAVMLYAGRRYFSLVSIPDWVSGVFDGKIRVSIDASRPPAIEVDVVLAYELAHAFIRETSKGTAPVWLHEGLAQWCSGRRIPRSEFRAELAHHSPLSLTELERGLAARFDPDSTRASYAEALGLVEYLVAVRGEGSVFCLVRDLGEGKSVAAALLREAALSPEGLLAAWKGWAGL